MRRRRLSRVVIGLGATGDARPDVRRHARPGRHGDLDPLFGDNGIVTTSFVGGSGEGSIGSFALARSIV